MSSGDEKWIPSDRLRMVASMAGIDVDDEGLAVPGPEIERFLAVLAKLDELSLGETEPAAIFAIPTVKETAGNRSHSIPLDG